MEIQILPATADQSEILTALTLRSKAHWGYSAEFMEFCRTELVVLPEDIEHPDFRYFTAARQGQVAGYVALQRLEQKRFILYSLFIDPAFIGKGVGAKLVRHVIALAGSENGKIMEVISDPHTVGFYLALGGIETGERESESIPGRFLPTLTIPLE